MKWTAEKMHDHCKECSECAANAVEHALKTNASRASSAFSNGVGEGAIILHKATVELAES